MGHIIQAFDGQDANGSSAAVKLRTGGVEEGPRRMHVFASGDIGGGTLTVDFSPDGGTTWHEDSTKIQSSALPAKRSVDQAGTHVRVTLASSTAPDLDVWLEVS